LEAFDNDKRISPKRIEPKLDKIEEFDELIQQQETPQAISSISIT
jgi:hypothetical protein